MGSLNDDGVAELNGICTFDDSLQSDGKNGYFILPQSLNLGVMDKDGTTDWSAFEHWCLTNEGDASIFFVDKQDVLDKIDGTTDSLELQKIRVDWEDSLDSKDSLFRAFPMDNGYTVEGFEAMEIDEAGNILLIMEYSKGKDTFDLIMVARFAE